MRTAVWKLTPARHKCENNKKGNNKTKKSSVRTAVKSYKERARKRTKDITKSCEGAINNKLKRD